MKNLNQESRSPGLPVKLRRCIVLTQSTLACTSGFNELTTMCKEAVAA
jgi:hypothetical protein